MAFLENSKIVTNSVPIKCSINTMKIDLEDTLEAPVKTKGYLTGASKARIALAPATIAGPRINSFCS